MFVLLVVVKVAEGDKLNLATNTFQLSDIKHGVEKIEFHQGGNWKM